MSLQPTTDSGSSTGPGDRRALTYIIVREGCDSRLSWTSWLPLVGYRLLPCGLLT